MNESGEKTPREILLEMRRQCSLQVKHCRKKHEKQLLEYEESRRWQWHSQVADSLLADQKGFPRGTQDTLITNVHTQALEEVRLNPKLDVFQNAELLYKKARKGKRGEEIAQGKLKATTAELKQLEDQLARCDALLKAKLSEEELAAAIEALNAELQGQPGAPRPATKAAAEVPKEICPFRHFTVDGFDIYVGKNNEQNDELTVHFAKPWDVWMHVTPHAGSHVIVRRPKGAPWPPQPVIVHAAELTAWFSKAKHATFADVHITEARFVHKPRRFPPGKVIAERCKTLHVKPKSPQDLFGGEFDHMEWND
jgi:predicted ribosome quality control (RQC) complex YloA/Tae2 family protein